MIRLPSYRPIPFRPQPAQVFVDTLFVFRTASRTVEVFDAKKERACRVAGDTFGRQCAQRVAEMERTRWGRCEARSDLHSAAAGTRCAASHSAHAYLALSVYALYRSMRPLRPPLIPSSGRKRPKLTFMGWKVLAWAPPVM